MTMLLLNRLSTTINCTRNGLFSKVLTSRPHSRRTLSHFTGFPFERSEHRRRNVTWQREQLISGNAAFAVVFARKGNDNILIKQKHNESEIAWLSLEQIHKCLSNQGLNAISDTNATLDEAKRFAKQYNILYVGNKSQDNDNKAHFALYSDKVCPNETVKAIQQSNDGHEAADCDTDSATLKVTSMRDAAINALYPMSSSEQCTLGVIHSLTTWAANVESLGISPGSVSLTDGGWSVQYTPSRIGDKDNESDDPHEGIVRPDLELIYPRIDPVIMALVVDRTSKNVLLCRKPAMAKTRYTCVAGFMEVGESIEEAVAREVREEVGLRVEEVQYMCSQPWPFGPRNKAQLMIGCKAILATDESAQNVMLDDELEEAYWFSKDEVRGVLANTETTAVPTEAIPARTAQWQPQHLRNSEPRICYTTAPQGSIANTLLHHFLKL